MPELSGSEWEDCCTRNLDVHLLQSRAWGDLKSEFGWRVGRIQAGHLGAQLLFRKLPLGYSFAYIPKGPVHLNPSDYAANDWKKLLVELDSVCLARKAVFLKIEPDLWSADSGVDKNEPPPGFSQSRYAIQPPRTLLVNIAGDEESILGRMKQKRATTFAWR